MAFVRAAAVGDVAEGSAKGVTVDGTAVLLARVDGEVYAMSDTCSHRGGTMSKGRFSDGVATCPRHGSQFDVRTGKNLRGPKILMFKGTTDDLATYAVKVEGDDILVDVGSSR